MRRSCRIRRPVDGRPGHSSSATAGQPQELGNIDPRADERSSWRPLTDTASALLLGPVQKETRIVLVAPRLFRQCRRPGWYFVAGSQQLSLAHLKNRPGLGTRVVEDKGR